MIDFILITFCASMFAGGFWCGKTYGSVKAMRAEKKSAQSGPKKLTCLRCKYKWLPRIAGRPAKCPNCQNRAWDQKRKDA